MAKIRGVTEPTLIEEAIGCRQQSQCAGCSAATILAKRFIEPSSAWMIAKTGKKFVFYGLEATLLHLISGECCADAAARKQRPDNSTEHGVAQYVFARLGAHDTVNFALARTVTDLTLVDDRTWQFYLESMAEPIEITVPGNHHNAPQMRSVENFALALMGAISAISNVRVAGSEKAP